MTAMDKINDALSHLKETEATIVGLLGEARTKVKAIVGDVNGDGVVDLKDVVAKVETSKVFTEFKAGEAAAVAIAKTWTLRDSKVLGGGVVLGYVVVKLFPILKPLLVALF